MKIRFFTPRANQEAMKSRIEKHLRAGDYGPATIRDHKKNADLIVFEMENRFEGINPDFERLLKAMEYKKEIAKLVIESPLDAS